MPLGKNNNKPTRHLLLSQGATSTNNKQISPIAWLNQLLAPQLILEKDLAALQKSDSYFGKIYSNPKVFNNYIKTNDLLFKSSGSKQKLVLPSSLLDRVINAIHLNSKKTYSKTKIKKIILETFSCNNTALNQQLQTLSVSFKN